MLDIYIYNVCTFIKDHLVGVVILVLAARTVAGQPVKAHVQVIEHERTAWVRTEHAHAHITHSKTVILVCVITAVDVLINTVNSVLVNIRNRGIGRSRGRLLV